MVINEKQEKTMTVCEYINNNSPFYHITPKTNIESILKDGIRPGLLGVCVVRSKDVKIINNIASVMLSGNGEKEFSVIEIRPEKYGISESMVAPDSIDEPTAPLHNYLVVDEPIKIQKEDIVIESFNVCSDISINTDVVTCLDGYIKERLPILPNLMLDD